MITSFIPWIGYSIYMMGVMPINIDIVPIFFDILCLFYAYALFNSNIFGTLALAKTYYF